MSDRNFKAKVDALALAHTDMVLTKTRPPPVPEPDPRESDMDSTSSRPPLRQTSSDRESSSLSPSPTRARLDSTAQPEEPPATVDLTRLPKAFRVANSPAEANINAPAAREVATYLWQWHHGVLPDISPEAIIFRHYAKKGDTTIDEWIFTVKGDVARYRSAHGPPHTASVSRGRRLARRNNRMSVPKTSLPTSRKDHWESDRSTRSQQGSQSRQQSRDSSCSRQSASSWTTVQSKKAGKGKKTKPTAQEKAALQTFKGRDQPP